MLGVDSALPQNQVLGGGSDDVELPLARIR